MWPAPFINAHAERYAKGHIVAAIASYIEDGDLESMWVTYTKAS